MAEFISEMLHPHTNGTSKAEDADVILPTDAIKKSGILQDIKAIGPHVNEDVMTLFEAISTAGKPYDDRTLMLEHLLRLMASLPTGSKMREKLTNALVQSSWDSLLHPPLSYFGEQFMFRTADGSYNNILYPHIGKAGTPYAKTVRTGVPLQGAKPDPGVLFDLLMAREDGKFKQNQSGLSSMLFYHATIIIHDIFRTNRYDSNISDTSSYLDMSPLYGKDQAAQDTVRTFQDGMLKPDTFAEERLLTQPPGVCVMLVMYSRFHNYIAQNLAAINDSGRFTMLTQGSPSYDADLKKRDNALFQTARLVVCGMYCNISIHDYLRAISNVNHSDSTWTLDPRVNITNTAGAQSVIRGVGNQCSAEFNLLYRFHSAVSEKDDKWTAKFFTDMFGDKQPEDMTIPEFIAGVLKYEATIPPEPEKRVFGGLTRDPTTGTFSDAAMVQILKDSIEDPAGAFGAKNVPKYLRIVEMLGILQARQWQMASLNEFRGFFGLKQHETFESINPDPEIADLLAKLYESPDMVELYPGLFIEDTKHRMDPGTGLEAPYTVHFAVLHDAVVLVRGDRFYTVDYTPATLTPWGMAEVQPDIDTLGGSMLYKLIHRAFPNWFKFNSIYVMQPMYTPKMNQEIQKELGHIDEYVLDAPAPPPKVTVLVTNAAIAPILKDQTNFKVKYGLQVPDLVFADYMLSGDTAGCRANKAFTSQRMNKCPGAYDVYFKGFEDWTRKILAREAYKLGKYYQVDMSKHVARPVVVNTHAEFMNLPICKRGETAGGMTEEEIYMYCTDYVNYANIDKDVAESWNLRRLARKHLKALTSATEELVKKSAHSTGVIGHFFGVAAAPEGSLRAIGQTLTKDLLDSGLGVEKTAVTCSATAAGGVANIPTMFVEALNWFLRPENKEHWSAVQELATQNTPEAIETLKHYVLEAARLSYVISLLRICVPADGAKQISIKDDKGNDTVIHAGEIVACALTAALHDPAVFPDPMSVKLDRPTEAYQLWGMGPHQCIGREIVIVGLTAMIKVVATLKNLRVAPGDQGQLKYTVGALGSRQYLTDDWSRFSPFAQAWKVHFDSF